MDPKFFRKYADLITEAEESTQLNEGITDSIMQYAKKGIEKLAPGALEKIQNLVSQALGKPIDQITSADLTLANAKKIIAANKQMTEADQNLSYNSPDGFGHERADIPGTIGKNQKDLAVIGGGAGGVLGLLAVISIPPLLASAGLGLAVLGFMAIACAIIGAKMASPDRGDTGRFKNRDGSFDTDYNKRDSRFGGKPAPKDDAEGTIWDDFDKA